MSGWCGRVNMNIEQPEHGERLNMVNNIVNPQKNVGFSHSVIIYNPNLTQAIY